MTPTHSILHLSPVLELRDSLDIEICTGYGCFENPDPGAVFLELLYIYGTVRILISHTHLWSPWPFPANLARPLDVAHEDCVTCTLYQHISSSERMLHSQNTFMLSFANAIESKRMGADTVSKKGDFLLLRLAVVLVTVLHARRRAWARLPGGK